WAVTAVAKSKVRGGERVGRILQRRNCLVRARRRIVDRGDVDGDCARGLIQIDTTTGRATIVLNLESEARVACTVGIGGGRENQQSSCDVGQGDELSGGHRRAVILETSSSRERAD